MTQLVIPRPVKDVHIPGLGKIFVYYSKVEEAQAARAELTKKLFDNRIVEASYLKEEAFLKRDYDAVDVAKD